MDGGQALSRLKETVISAIRVLSYEGVIDAFGHASARIPGTDRVLIPGHTHLEAKTIQEIDIPDLVTMDLEGTTVEGAAEPPGERFIHTGIYKARPDVGGIVHAHPPMAIAFGSAGRPILPVWTLGSVFAPAVPVYDNPGQIDTPALGDEVARALGGHAALLLRAHGAVTVGGSLEEACVIAVNLERNAAMQWVAATLGTPRPIEAQHLRDGMMKGVLREEYVNAFWAHYVKKMLRGRRD